MDAERTAVETRVRIVSIDDVTVTQLIKLLFKMMLAGLIVFAPFALLAHFVGLR